MPRFISALERAGALPTRVPAYLTTPGLPGQAGLDACAAERELLFGGHIAAIVFSSTAEVRRARARSRARPLPSRSRAAECAPFPARCPGAPGARAPRAARSRGLHGSCQRALRPGHLQSCWLECMHTPTIPRPAPAPQAQGLCRLMGGRGALAAAVERHGVVLAAHGPYTAAGASEVLGLPVPVVSKRCVCAPPRRLRRCCPSRSLARAAAAEPPLPPKRGPPRACDVSHALSLQLTEGAPRPAPCARLRRFSTFEGVVAALSEAIHA